MEVIAINHILLEFMLIILVCPEVAAGLGVPRTTLFLVKDIQKGVLVVKTNNTHIDVSDKIQHGIDKIIANLGTVYGFILKAKSPSCGVETVRVFDYNHGLYWFKG